MVNTSSMFECLSAYTLIKVNCLKYVNIALERYSLCLLKLSRAFDISYNLPLAPHHKQPFPLRYPPLDVDQTCDKTCILYKINPTRFLIRAADRKSTRLNSSHVATSYAVYRL